MVKEYRLEIHCFGQSEEDAAERAISMLNQGANFDSIAYLYDSGSGSQDKGSNEANLRR